MDKERKLKHIQDSIDKWRRFKKEVRRQVRDEKDGLICVDDNRYEAEYWITCGFCSITREEVGYIYCDRCLLNEGTQKTYCRNHAYNDNTSGAIKAADQQEYDKALQLSSQLLRRMHIIKKQIEKGGE